MNETSHSTSCLYTYRDGNQCQETCNEDSPFCYWHDPVIDKSTHDIKEKLEAWAKTGKPMDGFQLKKVDLSNINLVRRGSKVGYSFRDADLYRANLNRAHLFAMDFSGSSLMKADLSFSNLHCANLQGCNLLGVDIGRCRLENINWGDLVCQEEKAKEAQKEGESQLANDHCQEAEEIYRNVRKNCEKQGLFETAGYFFHREMVMRRYQMPSNSFPRFMSKMVDVFCGYGEKPLRVVLFSMTLILFCAITYFFLGISAGGSMLGFSVASSFGNNFMAFANCLYYSVVTFTTLGYGDFTPVGPSKVMAAIEAFAGSFTMALFVVVFVKKMTR
ncbi:ion channel [Litoribacillus peritrichatus]|uniref:Ion channel n=1 Tax=Litoribacillus peritrichatus TaxID=718191 RepID=A0ABP7N249_9GAMM